MESIPFVWLPQKFELFKVALWSPQHRHVYMWMAPNQQRCGLQVVIVERDRFLESWDGSQKGGYEDFKPDPAKDEMSLYESKIRKWNSVQEGFDEGCTNPVPLAEIARISKRKLFLDDGKKRTRWMLIHDVKVFPIACPAEYCQELNLLAGL